MSQEDTSGDSQPLGAFLRDQRKKLNASLEDATEATKISQPILRAIEEDDYERMPAEAFCRGFYTIYAEYLQLDSKEIISRYLDSRGLSSQPPQNLASPPIKKSSHFRNYAEPSAVPPAAGLGVLLVAALLVIIGICWYLNWSPTEYISRQFKPTPTVERPLPPEISTSEVPASDEIREEVSSGSEIPEAPPIQEAADESMPEEETLTATAPILYQLEIDVASDGTLNFTQGDGFATEKAFTSGETLRWDGKDKFLLDMPEEINATLRLNGAEQALPEAEDGRRQLSFPEDP